MLFLSSLFLIPLIDTSPVTRIMTSVMVWERKKERKRMVDDYSLEDEVQYAAGKFCVNSNKLILNTPLTDCHHLL
jgi:hypothetical protein